MYSLSRRIAPFKSGRRSCIYSGLAFLSVLALLLVFALVVFLVLYVVGEYGMSSVNIVSLKTKTGGQRPSFMKPQPLVRMWVTQLTKIQRHTVTIQYSAPPRDCIGEAIFCSAPWEKVDICKTVALWKKDGSCSFDWCTTFLDFGIFSGKLTVTFICKASGCFSGTT